MISLVFIFIASVLAFAGFVYLAARIQRLGEETASLRERSASQERLIAALTRRIWSLEKASGTQSEEPVAPPVISTPAATAETLPHAPSTPIPAPDRHGEPQPATEDWETRVGANWLNRAGALMLVIGIALFLGYSLTQLGPAGKVAIGLVAGMSMLVGGTILERHEQYRGFSFSLVGAGWAVIYFTGYAMHGLPAARLIDSPVTATILLLAISAGMIAHALRYRSELATGLAYLFGFVSLNVSPLTGFSVLASLLLALSLIGLAYRFSWFRLPLAGVVFTYLTFALRYDPSIFGRPGILNGQSTLWIYWLAFETFDLLDLRRRGPVAGIERSLFLLNACGFVGASLLHEWRMNSTDWAVFFGVSSIAYLCSAVIRARWAGRDTTGAERVFAGGYEAAATASAGLMAAALIERFSGIGITLALLMLGEMVLLAGLSLQNRYIRGLGGALLALPYFRLLMIDAPGSAEVAYGGLELERWTPVGLLMIAVFTMNRRLVRDSWYFSGGAGVLLFAVLMAELPSEWVGPVWALLALLAFLAGRHWQHADLKWMSMPAACFAALISVLFNIADGHVLTTVLVVVAIYAMQMLWRSENAVLGNLLSVVGTALLTALIFHEVQGRHLTVACGIEGAALVTAGFVLKERSLRLSGLILFLFCIGKLFAYDLRQLEPVSRILSFIVLGIVLLGASWVYARFREKLRRLL